jgi:hypothetical protein
MLAHARNRRLATEENALRVDRHHTVPFALRHVLDPRDRDDAGILHRDIDTSELSLREIVDAGDIGRDREIAADMAHMRRVDGVQDRDAHLGREAPQNLSPLGILRLGDPAAQSHRARGTFGQSRHIRFHPPFSYRQECLFIVKFPYDVDCDGGGVKG